MNEYRIERDFLGTVRVPKHAYWGSQTQRAIDNFPVSGIVFPRVFIRALAVVKQACATVNRDLHLPDSKWADAIITACEEARDGIFDDQFPLDIFQTGSGTSTNMNANEVLATRANEILTGSKSTSAPVHPNDHINMGQSSNDVIPTAIHVAARIHLQELLLPAVSALNFAIVDQQTKHRAVVKTGRTHLMDAMPITVEQEMSGWAAQVDYSRRRVESALPRVSELAIGGTAVGTGMNAPPGFGALVVQRISECTKIGFAEATNHFAAQASQDAMVELSGQLKTYATVLMKIANDLRWMNSGPVAGLGELRLPSLQPGSSMMPGKVNPVIPEAVRMVSAQVVGNDAVVALSNAMGEFQLNVMLPVILHNIIQSITLLARASQLLAEKAFTGLEVCEERMRDSVERNLMIATVLSPVIGYEKAAEVARKALQEHKTVKEVARELGYLSTEQIEKLLDPASMTRPGLMGT